MEKTCLPVSINLLYGLLKDSCGAVQANELSCQECTAILAEQPSSGFEDREAAGCGGSRKICRSMGSSQFACSSKS